MWDKLPDVGQDVAQDHAGTLRSNSPRRGDIVLSQFCQHATAYQPRVEYPRRHPKYQDKEQRTPVCCRAQDRYRQKHKREGQLDVPQAHYHRIYRSSGIARDETKNEPEHRGDKNRCRANDYRIASAVGETAGNVATQRVCPQGILICAPLSPCWRLESICQVLLDRVVWRDQGRKDRDQKDDRDPGQTYH